MSVEAADFMDDIGRPKRRDARFCVSRGSICCYCQRIIEWVYWYGLLVRRKILRLYWAVAIEYDGYYHVLYSLRAKVETQNFASHEGVYAAIVSGLLNGCIVMGRTGDARFCVSTGRTPLGRCGGVGRMEDSGCGAMYRGRKVKNLDIIFSQNRNGGGAKVFYLGCCGLGVL